MDLEPKSKFSFPAEILPQNERTFKIMAEREAEENQKRAEAEELKLMKDKEERDRKKKEKDQQREKEKRDKQAKDAAQKKKEEEEQMNKLEGRMLIMVANIKKDNTPKEYTVAGLSLGPARCRILASNVASNTSLVALHLARKGIQDSEGVKLAEMLIENKVLRKLELEGNLLGPNSARAFGEALKVNRTLKLLDLESNQLTQDAQDMHGIFDFIKCLYVNKWLLSLNLANNFMDDKCGELFEEATRYNTTLIDFEFGFNNFKLEDIRKIQDNLKRNKRDYDAERLKEWKERKLMNDEDVRLKNLYLDEQAKKYQIRMEEEAREAKERELDEEWRKYMLDNEIEKQQLIQQLEEAAKIRQEKGKKKRRGMAGKPAKKK